MSASTLEIGTISFCVNEPKGRALSNEEIYYVGTRVVDQFSTILQRSNLNETIEVLGFEVHRGCIIITISLGIKIAGSAGAGITLVTLLKDYKKIRGGAQKLAEDLNGLRTKPEKWWQELQIWYYRNDIKKTEELKKTVEQEKFLSKDEHDSH
jgi:hypothetical protein